MSENYASVALLKIDSPTQGRVALEDVVTFSVTTTQEKTPVNTMNRKRTARGYRVSTKAVSWELEVAVKKGAPEVDWEQLRDDNEEFMLTYERDDGGIARRLADCVVNEVVEDESEDGTATMRVSGLALDNRPVGP